MGALEIGLTVMIWGGATLVYGGLMVVAIAGWYKRGRSKSPPLLLVNADALAKVREINCGPFSDGSFCNDSGACECREIAALFTATPPKLVECGLCGVMRQQGVKCSWG